MVEKKGLFGMGNGNGNGGLTPAKVLTISIAVIGVSNTALIWSINIKSADRYTGTDAQKDHELVEQKLRLLEFRFDRDEVHINECLEFIREHERKEHMP